MSWKQRNQYVLPGGGPWKILPRGSGEGYCPALLHNTQGAACEGRPQLRCVCPRGLVLVEQRREYMKANNAKLARERSAASRNATREHANVSYLSRHTGAEMPELPNARCKTDYGKAIVDNFIDDPRRTITHRSMCQRCPDRVECLLGIRRLESEPGSWDGMYGGLTKDERRQLEVALPLLQLLAKLGQMSGGNVKDNSSSEMEMAA